MAVPAGPLPFSFIPLSPSIPRELKGLASRFNDPQFQKQVMGQLMRLATAYSTGQQVSPPSSHMPGRALQHTGHVLYRA